MIDFNSKKIRLIFFLLLLKINLSINKNLELLKCNSSSYFDTRSLKCHPCPENQTSIRNHPFYCVCKPGYKVNIFNESLSCIKCPENYMTSKNGLSCIPCSNDQVYNSTGLNCKKCSEGTILIDEYTNGSSMDSVECIKCNSNLIADTNANKCVPCHFSLYRASQGICKCPSSHKMIRGICASKADLASIPERKSSYIVNYEAGEYESNLFYKYYKISAYGCNFLRNQTSCQLLVNLCVLLHHFYSNELNICSYYKAVFGEKLNDLPKYIPILYYDIESTEKILYDSSFDAKFNIENLNEYKENSTNYKLNIYSTRYSFEGKPLSISSIEEAFYFCPEMFPPNGKLYFGTTFHSSCKLSVYFMLHEYVTEFHEFCLGYYAENEYKLYPFPILNLNFKKDTSKINYLGERNWQLTNRIFLIDTISGYIHDNTDESSKDNIPKFIRYIESIELFFELQKNSSSGQIYPPYMKVKYAELATKDLKKNDYVQIDLKIHYVSSSKAVPNTIAIATGISCGFAVALSIIKAWNASRRSGKYGLNTIVISSFLCLLCGYIANCIFFITFFVCSIWIFIYKNQDIIWIFLPGFAQEQIIKQFIIASFSLKIFHILYILYNQINVDLFFIDWEQPKSLTSNPSIKSFSNYKVNTKQDKNFVSIWRTYFIANKWNELQTHRRVNVPFVLFTMIFYLKVLDYEHICHSTISNNFNGEYTPFSFIIRFCLGIIIFMTSAFIHSVFRVVIYERYVENKLQMFVDLCSMANISVLIFKHHLYGFYIHGRSVYGEADLNMQSLYDQLKREEADLCQRRGLEPSSECQTFEVRITNKLRSSYDAILEIIGDASHNRPRNKLPTSKRIEHCIEAHEKMKKFLTLFLQHGLKGMDFIVKEKLFLENLLDLEFQEPKEKSLFFRDHCLNFDEVLMCGNESVFLTFEIMIFTFVDLCGTNFILAGIITYLVHRILKVIRYRGGKRNMIDKTLVDERFLI